jgi:hypothetical protein
MLQKRENFVAVFFFGLICPGAVALGLLGLTVLAKSTLVSLLAGSGQTAGTLGAVPALLLGIPFSVLLGMIASAATFTPTLLFDRFAGVKHWLKQTVRQIVYFTRGGLSNLPRPSESRVRNGALVSVILLFILHIFRLINFSSSPLIVSVGSDVALSGWFFISFLLTGVFLAKFLSVSISGWIQPDESDRDERDNAGDAPTEGARLTDNPQPRTTTRWYWRLVRPFRSQEGLLCVEVVRDRGDGDAAQPVEKAISKYKSKNGKDESDTIKPRELFETVTHVDDEYRGGAEWLDDGFVELSRSSGGLLLFFGLLWIAMGVSRIEDHPLAFLKTIPGVGNDIGGENLNTAILAINPEITVVFGVVLLGMSAVLFAVVPRIKMNALEAACREYCERELPERKDDGPTDSETQHTQTDN